MSLSCSCGDYEPEPGDKIWDGPSECAPLKSTRAKRCCSCNELIRPGALAGECKRAKIPDTDIECRIYGEDGEVPRASAWMCERCTDIAQSLEDLGFCAEPWEDQRELLREYVEIYGGTTNENETT